MNRTRMVLRPTDIPNPLEPGEPLYVWYRIRPRWYWQLKRLWLFARIVWRWHDTQRLDWRTAWTVARIIYAQEMGPA